MVSRVHIKTTDTRKLEIVIQVHKLKEIPVADEAFDFLAKQKLSPQST